jgi:predicted metal-binding membrane protein
LSAAAESALERLLKRDTLLVLLALAALIALAWLALLAGAGTGMSPFAMSGWLLPFAAPAADGAWTPVYWLIAFFMWAVMMTAMMLPSAAPTILLYARVVRQAERSGRDMRAPAAIGAFTLGYLAIWSLFSALAVLLHWTLERAGLLTVMMGSRSLLFSAALLIAAGLYQLSPLKAACLSHCRAPASFIAAHWRPGVKGACRMGLRHGAYCVGCCAVLMLLLFAGGIMNLVWIAALTLFVAVEKLAPFGQAVAQLAAAMLIAAGIGLVILQMS